MNIAKNKNFFVAIFLGVIFASVILYTTHHNVDTWNRIASEVNVHQPFFTIEEREYVLEDVIEHFRSKRIDNYLYGKARKSAAPWKANLGAKVLNSMYSYHGFKEVSLPETLEWNENPLNNRSWEWNHQQLTAIDFLMAAYFKAGDSRFLRRSVELVESWARSSLDPANYPSDFSWDDHATALRLERLLYLFEIIRKSDQIENQQLESILYLIYVHMQILSEDDFFNKFTNHGFSQAAALYSASVAIPELSGAQNLKELAINRLESEIDFMFTKEGVHVENSPAYHYWMTSALEELREIFIHHQDTDLVFQIEAIIEKAINFLAYVAKPDGSLPLVGDSTLTRLNFSQEKPYFSYPFFLYSASGGTKGEKPPYTDIVFPLSGYAVFRDEWHDSEDFDNTVFILFKSGFLSRFHRQDDDLNVVIWAFGENWLVDSGRYNYVESDPIRRYMRSPMAHNVPVLFGETPVRDRKVLRDGTGIEEYGIGADHSYVQGKTTVYEYFDIIRRVDFFKPTSFKISDMVIPLGGKNPPKLHSYFQIPDDKNIALDGEACVATILSRSGKRMVIKTSTGMCEGVEILPESRTGTISGITSLRFGTLVSAQTLVFSHAAGVDRVVFEVGFQ